MKEALSNLACNIITSDIITVVVCGLIIALIFLNISFANQHSNGFKTIRRVLNTLLITGLIGTLMTYAYPYINAIRDFRISKTDALLAVEKIFYANSSVYSFVFVVILIFIILWQIAKHLNHDTDLQIPSDGTFFDDMWNNGAHLVIAIVVGLILFLFWFNDGTQMSKDQCLINDALQYRTNRTIHKRFNKVKPRNASAIAFKWNVKHFKGHSLNAYNQQVIPLHDVIKTTKK